MEAQLVETQQALVGTWPGVVEAQLAVVGAQPVVVTEDITSSSHSAPSMVQMWIFSTFPANIFSSWTNIAAVNTTGVPVVAAAARADSRARAAAGQRGDMSGFLCGASVRGPPVAVSENDAGPWITDSRPSVCPSPETSHLPPRRCSGPSNHLARTQLRNCASRQMPCRTVGDGAVLESGQAPGENDPNSPLLTLHAPQLTLRDPAPTREPHRHSVNSHLSPPRFFTLLLLLLLLVSSSPPPPHPSFVPHLPILHSLLFLIRLLCGDLILFAVAGEFRGNKDNGYPEIIPVPDAALGPWTRRFSSEQDSCVWDHTSLLQRGLTTDQTKPKNCPSNPPCVPACVPRKPLQGSPPAASKPGHRAAVCASRFQGRPRASPPPFCSFSAESLLLPPGTTARLTALSVH
ncbi:unnamed protein product [Pleuronectes platessa]|uniref:Uncharacterized protein n=1 Tax=Pleuronectes platessa TaxID=8262 RepID=A0A9N7U7S3_PLEPL|nr:unnamed protein product [Pleuronectes platessa]